MIPQRERDLVKACLSYLRARGIPAWRNNTGQLMQTNKRGKTRPVRFGHKGSSDILGLLPPRGQFFAVECKVGRNKLRADQEAFIDDVRSAGGCAIVVRCLEDLMATVPPVEQQEQT